MLFPVLLSITCSPWPVINGVRSDLQAAISSSLCSAILCAMQYHIFCRRSWSAPRNDLQNETNEARWSCMNVVNCCCNAIAWCCLLSCVVGAVALMSMATLQCEGNRCNVRFGGTTSAGQTFWNSFSTFASSDDESRHRHVLGLAQTFCEKDLKTAWREYARKYHPDKCKEEVQICETKFIEGKAAHDKLQEILSQRQWREERQQEWPRRRRRRQGKAKTKAKRSYRGRGRRRRGWE